MNEDFTLARSRHFIKIQNSTMLLDEEQNRDYFRKIYLLNEHGFFIEREYDQYSVSVSNLLSQNKVLIIAESGMGKTCVMKYFKKQFGEDALFVDAGIFLGNIPSLDNRIDSNKDKQIVLVDGVDENPDVIPLLRSKCEILEKKKIFIASRNIENLHGLINELQLETYTLLPLSVNSVKEYAKKEDVKESLFLEAIKKKGLSPICAKPSGLIPLIEAYKDKTLNSTPNDELWGRYIQKLCSEKSKSSSGKQTAVTLNECMFMASKMALELMLSGCRIIECIHEETTENSKCLQLSALHGGADKNLTDNVLSRAIFTPTAEHCYKFAHSSFLDYFAAMGMDLHVNKNKWERIIINKERNSIYPQWEGVAAWLPRYDERWCDILLNVCPELLLASERVLSKVNSERLCECLLEKAESMDYDRHQAFHLRENLHRINQPEVIPVLRKALSTKCHSSKREMAITIIREARINKLENDLVTIFCDPKDEESIRRDAGRALGYMGSEKAHIQCKQILNQQGTSPALKGLVFSMTWPKHITINEINPHLIKEERNVFDAYEIWTQIDFLQSLPALTKEQVKQTLLWAISDIQKDNHHHDNILKMKKAVLTLCWNKFFMKGYFDLLLEGFRKFEKIHEYPFFEDSLSYMSQEIQCDYSQFKKEESKRQRLASVLIKDPSISGYYLTQGPFSMLFDKDIEFVLSEIKKEKRKDIREKWVDCLSTMFRAVSSKTKDQWDRMHNNYPSIIQEDAETIIRDAKRYQEAQEKEKKRQTDTKNKNTKNDLLSFRALLKEYPNINCLHNVFYACRRHTSSFRYADTPFWKDLSKDEINAIAKMANAFLTNAKEPERKPNIVYPLIPFASIILFQERPKDFRKLARSIWERFSTDILDFMNFDECDSLIPMLRFIKENARKRFREKMMIYIRDRLKNNQHLYLKRYESLIDKTFLKDLIKEYSTISCDAYFRFKLFHSIYIIDSSNLAELFRKISNLSECIEKFGTYSSIFFLEFHQESIKEFIATIKSKRKFGKKVFEDLMTIELRYNLVSSLFQRFEIDDLTDLYIWLHSNYPDSLCPSHVGGYSPDSIDELYLFISKIFSYICKSDNALPSLKRIKTHFPKDVFLNDPIKTAEYSELTRLCPKYSANEIKQIVDINNNKHVINTMKDLFDLTLEYLKRYETFLTGTNTPRVEDLWNVFKKNKKVINITHKDEENFSDHLKSYLYFFFKEFKIAINREVRLNEGRLGEKGSRTDIWIDAFSPNDSSHLMLCIEVKGSWNDTAKKALKQQLIDKYMRDEGANAGILLVGWFQSKAFPVKKAWSSMNSAKKDLHSQTIKNQKQYPLVEALVINCEYRI